MLPILSGADRRYRSRPRATPCRTRGRPRRPGPYRRPPTTGPVEVPVEEVPVEVPFDDADDDDPFGPGFPFDDD